MSNVVTSVNITKTNTVQERIAKKNYTLINYHERQTAGILDCCHFKSCPDPIYFYTFVLILSFLLSLKT